MTEAHCQPAERPSPAAALVLAFDEVLRQQMQGLPMVNPALAVEAVGFRPWREHWLGVLITPWFMNLLLMPRISAAWHAAAERESRPYVFPAGVFEFIGGRHAQLGDYQTCSLFSPMFDFADQDGARATAVAALEALFDSAPRTSRADPVPRTRQADPVPHRAQGHAEPARAEQAAEAAAASAAALACAAPPDTVSAARLSSKRNFLLGGFRGAGHGP